MKKQTRYFIIAFVVLLLLVIAAFVYFTTFTNADIYNNTGNDIEAYPVYILGEYGELETKYGKPIAIPRGESKRIKHGGVFVIKMQSGYYKYPVDFVVWREKEINEYGNWIDMHYQVDKDGELFVLKSGVSRPIIKHDYQPEGYPVIPEKLPGLVKFTVHVSRSSL